MGNQRFLLYIMLEGEFMDALQVRHGEMRATLSEYTWKPSALGMFWLFVFTSVLGVVIETIAYRFHAGMFICRQGVLYGPFSPVFGVGAVLAVLMLYRFRQKNGGVLFAISAVAGCLFEWAASWLQELVLGTRSWDYTYETFCGVSIPNIQGRTSLKMAVYWGLAGYLCIRVLYPVACMLVERISKRYINLISICLAVFLVWDISISVLACMRQQERREGIAPGNRFEVFLDETYPDDRLSEIFTNTLPADQISPLAMPDQ